MKDRARKRSAAVLAVGSLAAADESALANHRTDSYCDTARTPIKVLVVEDDGALREAIVDTLELAEFTVLDVGSAEAALTLLGRESVDMVISDVNMGGMDGHALLATIKSRYPMLPVLLVTAYASIERSVEAIQGGAVDYLVKPFEPQSLIDLVHRYALGGVGDEDQPVAVAATSRQLFAMAERVALTDSTVLLSGPSGVGKEVLARYIHRHSSRIKQPFIAINCAAIPETMLEATLFGHEKGAYTGAHQGAPGKFEQANGGTLLLDEVSEMNLGLQAKLLRVLQEREVERVGGRKLIRLDVRIIATTNRDLRAHVEAGQFREDLFYRLGVFPLQLPALAERRDDIVPLANRLLMSHCKKMSRPLATLQTVSAQALCAHDWPGNVRELDNVIQRALILQPSSSIGVADLLFDAAQFSGGGTAFASADIGGIDAAHMESAAQDGSVLESDLRQREYEIIQRTLDEAGGSKKDAADKLGVSPRTLRYKLAKMREEGLPV